MNENDFITAKDIEDNTLIANPERLEIIKKKVQYFFDNKIEVHIKKKDRIFLNGPIKEISADFFVLIDDVLGEEPVFFIEIFDVVKKMEKEHGL